FLRTVGRGAGKTVRGNSPQEWPETCGRASRRTVRTVRCHGGGRRLEEHFSWEGILRTLRRRLLSGLGPGERGTFAGGNINTWAGRRAAGITRARGKSAVGWNASTSAAASPASRPPAWTPSA